MTVKVEGASGEAPKRKSLCSKCGGVRNCAIKGAHEESHGDEHYSWNKEWYLLQCLGCENVFVETVSSNSEDYHQYYDQDGDTVTESVETKEYWPATAARKRPDWITDAGAENIEDHEDLASALKELYGALDNDLKMLAAIGIRTSFDVASTLLKVDAELSFAKKLKALVDGGHIGALDKDRLEILVDAGSASAHRGWVPSLKDLDAMMDVLEHFIAEAFIAPAKKKKMDAKVKNVKNAVPARKKKVGKGG